MADFPEERQGFTDMTFCLIRFEVTNIFRRILYIPPGPNRCTQFFAGLTVPEKEKWISDCHQRLEDKYLKNCDMSVPLCWVTATISRLVMSKMWLIVYHPHQRKDGGASLPQETKDKLFITSLENIEYSILLETEARTMKWGWLFRTYVQWHAIAFLLSELCVRTKGEAVDRAWRALEATAGRWWFPLGDSSPYRKGKAGCLWKPLRKLMAKARAAREKELALERASQAIRNGSSVVFSDLGQMVLPTDPTPASANQPNPETLDKMLPPEAPKLGEMPAASPPTWNGSPPLRNVPLAFPGAAANGKPAASPAGLHANGLNGNGLNVNGNPHSNAIDSFNHLSEHGLDFLVLDVMDGMAIDGTPADPSRGDAMPNYAGAMQNGVANINPLTQSEYTDSPLGVGGSSGQSSDSPVMDGGNMDWPSWDDMVTQYGMENPQGGQTANGAGHLGMVNWF